MRTVSVDGQVTLSEVHDIVFDKRLFEMNECISASDEVS